jgi:hypothetical protein
VPTLEATWGWRPKAAARRGERHVRHRMSAFCVTRARARAAATCRSGHSGQHRSITLTAIQPSELRQRPGSSVNRQSRTSIAVPHVCGRADRAVRRFGRSPAGGRLAEHSGGSARVLSGFSIDERGAVCPSGLMPVRRSVEPVGAGAGLGVTSPTEPPRRWWSPAADGAASWSGRRPGLRSWPVCGRRRGRSPGPAGSRSRSHAGRRDANGRG